MGSPAWIVFVRSGALGDFVVSLPLLSRLSRLGRPVCLVTRASYRSVLPVQCRCDRFVDVDAAAAVPFFGMGEFSTGVRDVLPGSDVFVFRRGDERVREQFLGEGATSIRFLPPRPSTPPHVALQFLSVVEPSRPDAGVLSEPVWQSRLSSPSGLWIHPGSGCAEKNVSPSAFARLAAAWKDGHDGEVWCSFGEADAGLLDATRSAFGHHRLRTRMLVCSALGELRDAMVRHAAYYLGNDSGVSHLAGASGIPGVALFRASDPAIWHPLGTVGWAWARTDEEIARVQQQIKTVGLDL